METQTENIAQVDNSEMFRAILDATLTSMGEMLGQMAAWAEPYFPLGAIEVIWLQAMLAGALIYVCMYGRRNLTHLGTLMKRADSGDATGDGAAIIGQRKPSTVANLVGELSLNLAGTLAGGYALISAFIGVLNIYSWMFLAIGG